MSRRSEHPYKHGPLDIPEGSGGSIHTKTDIIIDILEEGSGAIEDQVKTSLVV
jgi:hypothetical protein